jgi:hypothetical protein
MLDSMIKSMSETTEVFGAGRRQRELDAGAEAEAEMAAHCPKLSIQIRLLEYKYM